MSELGTILIQGLQELRDRLKAGKGLGGYKKTVLNRARFVECNDSGHEPFYTLDDGSWKCRCGLSGGTWYCPIPEGDRQ